MAIIQTVTAMVVTADVVFDVIIVVVVVGPIIDVVVAPTDEPVVAKANCATLKLKVQF